MSTGWKNKDHAGYAVPWHTPVKGSQGTIKPVDKGNWPGKEKAHETSGGPGSSHKGTVGGKD
jgi:hypothetical protein